MKSLEELKAIREKLQSQVGLRADAVTSTRVVVGMGTCGIASGSRPVLSALSDLVQEKKLEDIKVVQTGCLGLCNFEPLVEVIVPGQEKVVYVKMTPERARDVVDQHLIRGKIVEEYTINYNSK